MDMFPCEDTFIDLDPTLVTPGNPIVHGSRNRKLPFDGRVGPVLSRASSACRRARGGRGEVRGAAQVKALAVDGVSQTQIAARLRINRWTVKRLMDAEQPPRYRRAPEGSMLDPLEPVIRRVISGWPEIQTPRVTELLREDYGYTARLIWCASGWRRCGRAASDRRSGPATGRGTGAPVQEGVR
jgi:hypothetical protein